jgi:hypothetical protein
MTNNVRTRESLRKECIPSMKGGGLGVTRIVGQHPLQWSWQTLCPRVEQVRDLPWSLSKLGAMGWVGFLRTKCVGDEDSAAGLNLNEQQCPRRWTNGSVCSKVGEQMAQYAQRSRLWGGQDFWWGQIFQEHGICMMGVEWRKAMKRFHRRLVF